MESENTGEAPSSERRVGSRATPQQRSRFSWEHKILLDILIQARHSANLSQAQLATRLKKVQSHVAYIEKGGRDLNAVEVLRWCEACEVSFVEFARKVEDSLRAQRLQELCNESPTQPSE